VHQSNEAKKLGVAVPLLLSHCLYARLGFQTREPLSVVQGPALNIKFAAYDVRPAIEADIAACNLLCRRVHGFEHGARQDIARHLARRSRRVAANWLEAPTGLLLLYALKARNYIVLRRRSLCPR
jgi:hypothetical protein